MTRKPEPMTLTVGPPPVASDVVDIEIVVPVFNEQDDLEPSVRRLHAFLQADFPFTATITIADNASTDGTWAAAVALACELPGVTAVHLDAKGRGRALQQAWTASTARVVAYMDVDLSTHLAALLPLVAPLLSGHSDVAIGTRLSRTAQVVRGPKREIISRCYNLLLRTTLRARFSDAQCGFKAMRTECARALLPHVFDTAWFFDTELLVLAERSGLRIAEVPVDWVDDPDSRVDLAATAVADLRGVARLARALVCGDLPVRELRQQLGRGRVELPGVPVIVVESPFRSLVTPLVRYLEDAAADAAGRIVIVLLEKRRWLSTAVDFERSCDDDAPPGGWTLENE